MSNAKFGFTSGNAVEINIPNKQEKFFYPIKGIPEFKNGTFTVYEYTPSAIITDAEGLSQKPPQVPYEIKEHALKGFVYTFFLVWTSRLFSNFSYANFLVKGSYSLYPFIPLGVFVYQYSRVLHYMLNAVTAIKLKENGSTVILEFKNFRSPLEVEIWRISKNKEENFFYECYSEPFLFPITIDYSDIKGQYSLLNKKTFYIYGDSNNCIKHGEIFRAILNSQSIKLE